MYKEDGTQIIRPHSVRHSSCDIVFVD